MMRIKQRRLFLLHNRSYYLLIFVICIFGFLILVEVYKFNELEESNHIANRDSEYMKFGAILGQIKFLSNLEDEDKEMVLPSPVASEYSKLIFDSSGLYLNETKDLVANLLNYSSPFFTNDWQSTIKNNKFYVYSAYFDGRRQPLLRVIATTTTKFPKKVNCKLFYSTSSGPIIVPGVNKAIRENWNLKYSAYFVLCLLGSNPIPEAVSIIPINRKYRVYNLLRIQNHPKLMSNITKGNLAVCVKPFHYNYNRYTELIEFIELNRLLGADHFLFYNHSTGKEVDCLLKQYIQDETVSLLPWNLNMKSQEEIRTEGLFAALNDCLYRTMYRFKYVLMIDFDEFVIPHSHDDILSMITAVNGSVKSGKYKIGGYSFQNAFFYHQWPGYNTKNQIFNNLITLTKTRRKSKFHVHKQRSKVVLVPELIVEMGNHFVWEFITGSTVVNVSPTIGFLHHYRQKCEFGGEDCLRASSKEDRRVWFWKNDLINKFGEIFSSFNSTCMLTEQ